MGQTRYPVDEVDAADRTYRWLERHRWITGALQEEIDGVVVGACLMGAVQAVTMDRTKFGVTGAREDTIARVHLIEKVVLEEMRKVTRRRYDTPTVPQANDQHIQNKAEALAVIMETRVNLAKKKHAAMSRPNKA